MVRKFRFIKLFKNYSYLIVLLTLISPNLIQAALSGSSYETDASRQDSSSESPSGSANTAVNFTGTLNGDVTGAQDATVVSIVHGQTGANIAAGVILANAATDNNVNNAIVRRDNTGNFSASAIISNLIGNVTGNLAGTVTGNLIGNITGNLTGSVIGNVTGNVTGNAATATTAGSATNFTGNLVGDVIGTQAATVVSNVGGQIAANLAAGAVLANAATDLNTASTIVKRDSNGNFTASTVTANTVGTHTGNTSGNVTGNVTGNLATTQMILATAGILINHSIVKTTVTSSGQAISVANTTSIQILNITGGTGPVITFPTAPVDGQILTITSDSNATGITYASGNSGFIVSSTQFNSSIRSVTFVYYAGNNTATTGNKTWYRIS
jgi:hypothetical protein